MGNDVFDVGLIARNNVQCRIASMRERIALSISALSLTLRLPSWIDDVQISEVIAIDIERINAPITTSITDRPCDAG